MFVKCGHPGAQHMTRTKGGTLNVGTILVNSTTTIKGLNLGRSLGLQRHGLRGLRYIGGLTRDIKVRALVCGQSGLVCTSNCLTLGRATRRVGPHGYKVRRNCI